MDFDDTPEEAAYRARVRTLLAEHAADLVHLDAGEEAADAAQQEQALRRTQRVLADAGLVGVSWAREHGGQAGTLAQQAIVNQELARARVPTLINHIGLGMCGPTVVAHGTPDQHERYLARLLRAEDVWCQLFSEPASGSDLAALRTTAVRDGDEWVVNGQKVWTTLAHVADFGILLARTDPDRPKHAGLTMFIVDMHAPGVDRAAAAADDRRRRTSTRSSSTTCAPRQRPAGRAGGGLAGRADHADQRAGRRRRRRQRPRPLDRVAGHARRRPGAAADPGPPGAGPPGAGPGRGRRAGQPLHRLPALHRDQPRRPARPRGQRRQARRHHRRELVADAGVRLLGDDAVYSRGRPATTAAGSATRRGCPASPSPAAPTRCCATSSASGCWACRRNPARTRPPPSTRGRAVNFELDDDQRAAAAGAREFFTGSASPADARARAGGRPGHPGRKALADIGFLGITVPEAAGGAGSSVLDLAVVAEQAGAVLAGPSLVTAARAAVLLADLPELLAAARRRVHRLRGGRRDRRRRWTPRLPTRSSPWRTARWCSAPARSPPAAPMEAPAGWARCGSPPGGCWSRTPPTVGPGPGRRPLWCSPPRTSARPAGRCSWASRTRRRARVRPADRLLPGGQAPARGRLGGGRPAALAGLVGGLGRRRRTGRAAAGRRGGQGVRGGGAGAGRANLHPGARRDRRSPGSTTRTCSGGGRRSTGSCSATRPSTSTPSPGWCSPGR